MCRDDTHLAPMLMSFCHFLLDGAHVVRKARALLDELHAESDLILSLTLRTASSYGADTR